MNLKTAQTLANRVLQLLEPHCERIEIAGSIRRKKAECGDIEIVCIPKPYEVGLFASGVALVINNWHKVKGELPCKYTQRILPGGATLDIFFAEPDNWGYIFAIRTGSADYSYKVLASRWKQFGYHGKEGMLHDADNNPVPIREEIELFNLLNLNYLDPEKRNV